MTKATMFRVFIDRGAREANLSAAARVVWVVIFRHVVGRRTSLSVGRISRSTGLAPRVVAGALAELKAAGMIRARDAGPRSGRYRIAPVPDRGQSIRSDTLERYQE